LHFLSIMLPKQLACNEDTPILPRAHAEAKI
jgi:hypothetical protein